MQLPDVALSPGLCDREAGACQSSLYFDLPTRGGYLPTKPPLIPMLGCSIIQLPAGSSLYLYSPTDVGNRTACVTGCLSYAAADIPALQKLTTQFIPGKDVCCGSACRYLGSMWRCLEHHTLHFFPSPTVHGFMLLPAMVDTTYLHGSPHHWHPLAALSTGTTSKEVNEHSAAWTDVRPSYGLPQLTICDR